MLEYRDLDSFESSNRAWMRVAPELGWEAARTALSNAGIGAQDIDHFFVVTCTGIATPSIDARVITALGMRPDVKCTLSRSLRARGDLFSSHV